MTKFMFSLAFVILMATVGLNNGEENVDMFETLAEHLAGKGALIADKIESLIAPERIDALYDLVDLLDDDVLNRTACRTCRTVMATLKGLSAIIDWEDARDPVVEFCYFLFENLTDEYVNTDVLCPGIIDIQGPHVYEILRPIHRKSPEDICRNLNSCFPPRESDKGDIFQDSISTPKQNTNTRRRSKRRLGEPLEERKANAIKIVQMSDIHIEPAYAEDTNTECGLAVCCIERYGPGEAGFYGDYKCNIPQRTMELFFHKTVELDPAFVIFSGDTPPHKMWDETYSSQLNCTGLLVEAATRILGSYAVYPNIGNHEMYPTNLFSMQFLDPYTQDMAAEFATMWTDLAGFTEEQQATMRAGGYYTISPLPGLRILSFNTNYWYTFNFYSTLNEGEQEVEDMSNFMRDTLELARQNGEKVIIIGHHPPGNGDSIVLRTREFENLVADYSDVILLQVAGHTHYDHYKVLSDAAGNALSMTYITAPVTTKTDHNPSMRVFYMDATTFEIIDYEQYGFNLLEAAGSEDPPSIDFIYSAMEEYGLPDMSPTSWKELTERMEVDTDLYERYVYNYYSRYDEERVCEDACKASLICGTQFYSFDETVYCTEAYNETGIFVAHDKVKTQQNESVFSQIKGFINTGLQHLANWM